MGDYDYGGSWRWAQGLIAAASLDATYDLTALPRAADMPDILDWIEPGDGSDLYNDVAIVQESMDGSLGGQGGGNVTWALQGMTPLMVAYIATNRFDGRKKSANATIMTFDPTFGWVKLWCVAQWPRDMTSLRRIGNVYDSFPVLFTDTRTAT